MKCVGYDADLQRELIDAYNDYQKKLKMDRNARPRKRGNPGAQNERPAKRRRRGQEESIKGEDSDAGATDTQEEDDGGAPHIRDSPSLKPMGSKRRGAAASTAKVKAKPGQVADAQGESDFTDLDSD